MYMKISYATRAWNQQGSRKSARIPQESRKDSSRLYGFWRKDCWVLNDLLVLLLVFVWFGWVSLSAPLLEIFSYTAFFKKGLKQAKKKRPRCQVRLCREEFERLPLCLLSPRLRSHEMPRWTTAPPWVAKRMFPTVHVLFLQFQRSRS